MRKLTPLVGLILSSLVATASAEETKPAAEPTTPPAVPNPVPGTEAPKEAAAPAEAAVATPAPTTTGVKQRKLQVGLAFLPMALGKYTFNDTFTTTASSETYFAYGFGVSAGYEVLPGLIVGIAPQVIFNVQPKPMETANPAVAKEYDLLARVAYELRPVEGLAVYAEVLPGYSRIAPSDEATPSNGFVLAFGAGVLADMTDRFFLNVGGGYQIGFQSQSSGVHTLELRTKFVRVAMGGGVRF
jgi:hypothetical protein